jgi:ribosomal protein S18 acetylase RimI-like enzyme
MYVIRIHTYLLLSKRRYPHQHHNVRPMKSTKEQTSRITIRKMKIQDYTPLTTLWNEGGLPYRPQGRDSRQHIAQQLRQRTSLYYVAEQNGIIVGAILGTHDGRKGWINRLIVAPAYRKKGIAKRLVQEVEHQLTAIGIDIIACLVEDWNTVSETVFERLGYTKHTDILYYSKRKNMKI